MMFRSVALFAHVIGMLVLFVGLAFEWLSLESLQRSHPTQAASAIAVLRALPRYIAGGVALIVVSGIYLAARVGVLDLAWVRVSLGSMVAWHSRWTGHPLADGARSCAPAATERRRACGATPAIPCCARRFAREWPSPWPSSI
jgi:hypothetical protein